MSLPPSHFTPVFVPIPSEEVPLAAPNPLPAHEFGRSRRDIESSRRDIESSRRDIESSRRDIESSRRDIESSRRDIERVDYSKMCGLLTWVWYVI